MRSEYFYMQPFFFPSVLSDNMPAVRWRETGNTGLTIPATFTMPD